MAAQDLVMEEPKPTAEGAGPIIEVEDLKFGERSAVLLDPAEERIKAEFEGVKCTMLPMHSILRIDEVKKQGVSKISTLEGGSNVAQFPIGLYQPSGSEPGGKK